MTRQMPTTENPTDGDTTGNSNVAVTAPVSNVRISPDAGPVKIGSVVLRGVTVVLDTDVGQAFVADCARHTEGLAVRQRH